MSAGPAWAGPADDHFLPFLSKDPCLTLPPPCPLPSVPSLPFCAGSTPRPAHLPRAPPRPRGRPLSPISFEGPMSNPPPTLSDHLRDILDLLRRVQNLAGELATGAHLPPGTADAHEAAVLSEFLAAIDANRDGSGKDPTER